MIFILFGFFVFEKADAGVGDNISGWTWSENIGWISFNNTTGGGTTNYGVNINPSTGIFSGYAWSENIGWITFNESELSGCPVSPCRAWLDSSNNVQGWSRALAYGGGWDGWIKMSDGTYGVNVDLTNGDFHGWAWSDMVIGWISFNSTDAGAGGAAYKVVLDLSKFNRPPTAINLSVDDPNAADYCGITGYPPVRVHWQFSDLDSGDSQSAYQIQVDDNSDFSSLLVDTGKISNSSQSFLIGPSYPTLSWNATYYWRLKVWDSKDTSSTDWIVYQDNVPPLESFTTASHSYPYPNFTFSPQNPAIGEVVTFIDNSKCYSSPGNTEYNCSTGGSISYLWDFGNGQTSTTKGDVTTTYATAGPKTVRLTITDNNLTPAGSCDTTRQVTVALPFPEWEEIPPF